MPVSFSHTFICDTCGAVIQYRDERPEWMVDPARQAFVDEGREWIERHGIDATTVSDPKTGRRIETAVYLTPESVELIEGLDGELHVRLRAIPTRYIVCPSCDCRVYERIHDEEHP